MRQWDCQKCKSQFVTDADFVIVEYTLQSPVCIACLRLWQILEQGLIKPKDWPPTPRRTPAVIAARLHTGYRSRELPDGDKA